MLKADITRARLHSQKAAGSALSIPALVSWMGAMQGQDYNGGLWAIGLRTGSTEKQVIAALEKTEIVRTWPQRGTLHFVTREDAGWMVGLSAERMLAGAQGRRDNLGLDNETLQRAEKAFAGALKGGIRLSRPEMMAALAAVGISPEGSRGYHLLWYCAQIGLIYIGPMAGKQQTFALLADLGVKPPKKTRAELVGELAARFFSSHGPATLQDFMGWSGLTSTEAKAGLKAAPAALTAVKIDGKEYWLAEGAGDSAEVPEMLLLPGFDEYILGYKERSAQLAAGYLKKIVPGSNGVFLASVVRRGQVVGLWRRAPKKAKVKIEVEAFERLTKADKLAIEARAHEYGKFMGLPAEIGYVPHLAGAVDQGAPAPKGRGVGNRPDQES